MFCAADCTRDPVYKAGLPTTIIWRKCQACDHVFTDGYFSDEALSIIFSTMHDNQRLTHEIEQQRNISARMVEKVLPYADHGTWLDVGFGNGSLLFTAQEYGFHPVGIDLREDNVKALRALGIEAHCSDLATLTLSQPCTIISMADVLEHIPYPKQGLADAARLLTDDGIVLISMPNRESMLWRVLDQSKGNPYWGVIEHYHNFTRARLYNLLRETGFTPVRYGVSERYRAGMEVIARKTPACA
ncbi:MAG: class I SAM-dependent methyltransferase [Gammaproteobacteria bacterium]